MIDKLNGRYRIFIDGELALESKNLITDSGSEVIKQYLAKNLSDWAGGLAVGSISTAATVADTKLGFEVSRQPVLSKTVSSSGYIVLRASFPNSLSMIVRELGIYPTASSTFTGTYQDALITDFSTVYDAESAPDGWVGTVDSSTTSSLGSSNIKINSSNSATANNLAIDVTGYSQTDKFELLVSNLDGNSKTITATFNGSQSVTFTTAASNSLQSLSATIGSAIIDLQTITSITFSTSSGTYVSLDGFKFLNTDENTYYTRLVSRSIPTEIVKTAGQEMEIEYILAGL